MSTAFALAAFERDLREVLDPQTAPFWPVMRVAGQMAVVVLMTREANREERFAARVTWANYPDEPPSLKFLDLVTGRDDVPQAWPEGSPFRPGSLDTCANYCIEGFNLHQEWKHDANLRWSSDGNPLLKVLRYIQTDLDVRATGRFKG